MAEKIIERFDEQIKKEYKAAKGDKDRCPSYWQKLIFIKSKSFSIADWREVRGGDYWIIRDSKTEIDRDKFILSRIKEYLNTTK